jgi:hypothetical protein
MFESKVFRELYNTVSWKCRICEFDKKLVVWLGWTCSSDGENIEEMNIEFR